jgi:hypothetical protein
MPWKHILKMRTRMLWTNNWKQWTERCWCFRRRRKNSRFSWKQKEKLRRNWRSSTKKKNNRRICKRKSMKWRNKKNVHSGAIRHIRALASEKEPRERICWQATEFHSSQIKNHHFLLGANCTMASEVQTSLSPEVQWAWKL